jgi:hypothetical protein
MTWSTNSNPEGTGIRVSTHRECYESLSKLANDPHLCDQMGSLGKKLALSTYTERNQREDLEQLFGYLRVMRGLGNITENLPTGEVVVSITEFRDKVKRKILSLKPTAVR